MRSCVDCRRPKTCLMSARKLAWCSSHTRPLLRVVCQGNTQRRLPPSEHQLSSYDMEHVEPVLKILHCLAKRTM
ncbi:hypothetical protein A1O3_04917 [Capronia epimyces CBS 606.96]|uniref:Uncharacterized protein n=1 Tax=Capronia epimyces CBS 606.96 TaxID=1182542 RepID=W9Y3M2_9EURO|nr:uncharacterized protein A1O3_04917 [Capronia epimyces CBS 606.96]EXJ84250.1 hypothetical protein A1O3_04917 [Capronia epimyces CBS 606.96]